MKKEKGITLVGLVMSIIILIIISSIAVYSGTGTVRYAKFNKAKSEMEIMQTNVNSWYQEYQKIEVSDSEEIPEGKTKEDVKIERQVAFINNYGVETGDSSCDETALAKTVNATGITASDYRFLSEDYVRGNFGLNDSFDFLVNISERKVILFNGLKYNGKMFYTAEDFGVYNVENVSFVDIDFKLSRRNETEVIIDKLYLIDNKNNKANISKFNVQYKKESDTNWTNVTNRINKFIEDDEVKYKFSILDDGKFYIRVSTIDKKIEKSQSILVGNLYKIYVKQGLVMQLDGEMNSEFGHSSTMTNTWYNVADSNNNATIVNGCSVGENYIKLSKALQQYITTNLVVFDKTYTIEMVFSPKSFYNYNALWSGSGLRNC